MSDDQRFELVEIRAWASREVIKSWFRFIDESDPDVPVVDHVLLPEKENK